MSKSGCNHEGFAAAVRYSDAKRAGGKASTSGGTEDSLDYVRGVVGNSLVANGVKPGGQKVK